MLKGTVIGRYEMRTVGRYIFLINCVVLMCIRRVMYDSIFVGRILKNKRITYVIYYYISLKGKFMLTK